MEVETPNVLENAPPQDVDSDIDSDASSSDDDEEKEKLIDGEIQKLLLEVEASPFQYDKHIELITGLLSGPLSIVGRGFWRPPPRHTYEILVCSPGLLKRIRQLLFSIVYLLVSLILMIMGSTTLGWVCFNNLFSILLP